MWGPFEHDEKKIAENKITAEREKEEQKKSGMTKEEEDKYVDNEIKKYAESIGMRYYTDAEIEQIEPDCQPYR